MHELPPIGTVVQSKAGRDAGRYFMVLEHLDAQHVLTVDGRLRRLNKPKKKKVRHLCVKPVCLMEIQEKIVNGRRVFDADIRSGLETAGYGIRPCESKKEASISGQTGCN